MGYYDQTGTTVFSNHATMRMSARGIRRDDVELVMTYGRVSHVKNAVIFAVGRKEIKENGKFLSRCEGLHVLCSTDDGAVITTYKNQSLRGLRR